MIRRVYLSISLIISHQIFAQSNDQPINLRGSNYETLPVHEIADIFPEQSSINDNNYQINPWVQSNGYNYIFQISSPYGYYDAIGKQELVTRIKEIIAMETLEELSRKDEFKTAFKESAKSPIKAVKKLLNNPVKTITGIPKGAVNLGMNATELMIKPRSKLEEGRLKEFVGFSSVKRQYAHILDIDVYSTNEALQTSLNKIAWTAFSAALGPSIVYSAIQGPGGKLLKGTKMTNTLNEMVLNNSPEDLKRRNRKQLEIMGVDRKLITKYCDHDWLSPRHQTSITLLLEEMNGVFGRDKVIEAAVLSEDVRQSDLIQRMVQQQSNYHKNRTALRRLHSWRRLVVGESVSDTMILILPVDHLYWTEITQSVIQGIEDGLAQRIHPREKIIIISGGASEFTKQELMSRGWLVRTDTL